MRHAPGEVSKLQPRQTPRVELYSNPPITFQRAKCLWRPRRLSHEGRDRASPTCSSRPKLVQVRVASLSLSIQRGVLEDDLSIFLLFYEPLYHARERESFHLAGELTLS